MSPHINPIPQWGRAFLWGPVPLLNLVMLNRSVGKVGQLRSLPSPERLRVYALKRFTAQACRQVGLLSCSRFPMYAPRTKAAAVLPKERCVLAHAGWAGETAGLFEQSFCFHDVRCHQTDAGAIEQILSCSTDAESWVREEFGF